MADRAVALGFLQNVYLRLLFRGAPIGALRIVEEAYIELTGNRSTRAFLRNGCGRSFSRLLAFAAPHA